MPVPNKTTLAAVANGIREYANAGDSNWADITTAQVEAFRQLDRPHRLRLALAVYSCLMELDPDDECQALEDAYNDLEDQMDLYQSLRNATGYACDLDKNALIVRRVNR